MKWESDQRLGDEGVFGWESPARKGQTEQPRWKGRVDIAEALADPPAVAVLQRWWSARSHEAPAFSGGVLDAWPALMVDGLAVCRTEESAIGDFRKWEVAGG